MAPTMTHLAMHVRDLPACITFYEKYCGMRIVHDRDSSGHRVVWLAEKRRERDFILVLMPGGPGRDQQRGATRGRLARRGCLGMRPEGAPATTSRGSPECRRRLAERAKWRPQSAGIDRR